MVRLEIAFWGMFHVVVEDKYVDGWYGRKKMRMTRMSMSIYSTCIQLQITCTYALQFMSSNLNNNCQEYTNHDSNVEHVGVVSAIEFRTKRVNRVFRNIITPSYCKKKKRKNNSLCSTLSRSITNSLFLGKLRDWHVFRISRWLLRRVSRRGLAVLRCSRHRSVGVLSPLQRL